MAKKHRLTRNQHRNRVKNKRNAKPGLRNRFKPRKRKSKYGREYFPTLILSRETNYSSPWSIDGGVEACKARVEEGMKCYCLEVCWCRECGGCRTSKTLPPDDCVPLCKTCSKHVPCR